MLALSDEENLKELPAWKYPFIEVTKQHTFASARVGEPEPQLAFNSPARQFHLSTLEKPLMASTGASSSTRKNQSKMVDKDGSIVKNFPDYRKPFARLSDNVPPPPSRDSAIPPPSSTRNCRAPPPPPPRDSRKPLLPPSQDTRISTNSSSDAKKKLSHEMDKNDLIGKTRSDYKQPRPFEIPPPPSYPRPVPSAPNQPVQNPHLNPILPSLPLNVRVVAEQRSGQTDNISSPPVVPPPSTQAQFCIFVPPTPVCTRPGEKFQNPGNCPQGGFFTKFEPGMLPPGYPTLIYVLPPNHDSNDFSTGAMQSLAKKILKSSECVQNGKHNELSNRRQWKPRYSNNSRPLSEESVCSTRNSGRPSQERFSNYRRDKVARYEPYSRQPLSIHRSPNTSHQRHQHRKNESYTENTPVSRKVSEFRNIGDKDVLRQKGEEHQEEGDSRKNHIYSIEIEKIFTKGLHNQYKFENLNLAPNENEEEEENRMEVLKFFVYHLLKQKKKWFKKGEEGSKNGGDDYLYLDGSRSIKVKGANFRGKRGNHEISLPLLNFSETQRQSLKSVLKQDFQSVEIKLVITKTKVPQKEQAAYLEKLTLNKHAEKILIAHCLRAK